MEVAQFCKKKEKKYFWHSQVCLVPTTFLHWNIIAIGQNISIFCTLPLLEEATYFNHVAVDKCSNFPRAKIDI